MRAFAQAQPTRRMKVPLMTDHPQPRNEDPSTQEESVQLHWELVLRLDDVRRGLQKWHAATRRVSGNIASDVYRGQGRALSILAEHGQMPQHELCAQMGVRPQSLAEIVAKLERGGYIERHVSPTDGRVQIVHITESGLACLQNGQRTASFDCFSDDEIRQFIDYLRRASESIEADCEAMAKRPACSQETGPGESQGCHERPQVGKPAGSAS